MLNNVCVYLWSWLRYFQFRLLIAICIILALWSSFVCDRNGPVNIPWTSLANICDVIIIWWDSVQMISIIVSKFAWCAHFNQNDKYDCLAIFDPNINGFDEGLHFNISEIGNIHSFKLHYITCIYFSIYHFKKGTLTQLSSFNLWHSFRVYHWLL